MNFVRVAYKIELFLFVTEITEASTVDLVSKAGPWIRIRMDQHSFSLLDPDPHSICGSGSRREKLSDKNGRNARKLVITARFYKFVK